MKGQFRMRVGGNIKKYRKLQGMTLKELAEKLDLTEATIQKYEAGNIKTIDVYLLGKIADALDVLPENLTEWGDGQYEKYREEKRGEEEAKLVYSYNQLTKGHKKVVRNLIANLIECQEKYNSDK